MEHSTALDIQFGLEDPQAIERFPLLLRRYISEWVYKKHGRGRKGPLSPLDELELYSEHIGIPRDDLVVLSTTVPKSADIPTEILRDMNLAIGTAKIPTTEYRERTVLVRSF